MRTTSWLNFAIHSEHLLPFWMVSCSSVRACVCVRVCVCARACVCMCVETQEFCTTWWLKHITDMLTALSNAHTHVVFHGIYFVNSTKHQWQHGYDIWHIFIGFL